MSIPFDQETKKACCRHALVHVRVRPSSSKLNATCTCAVRRHGTTLLALTEPRCKSAHSTKPAPTHPRERATSSPAASCSSLVWQKIDLSQKSATNSIPTVPRAHSRKDYEIPRTPPSRQNRETARGHGRRSRPRPARLPWSLGVGNAISRAPNRTLGLASSPQATHARHPRESISDCQLLV